MPALPPDSVASATPRCIAFAGHRRIAAGDRRTVALAVKAAVDRGERAPVLIFEEATSGRVELDLRGSVEDVVARLERPDAAVPAAKPPARGPGRPRLGVVAREVTLLPRHWDWLAHQPGGASVALRRLVDEARRAGEGADRVRAAREAAYRFLTAIGGDLPGYEEALRALFAGDRSGFGTHIRNWPIDVREHAEQLADGAF